ncbi:hypothetical protein [Nocardia goodfellowii]|uniref:Uncharacterized protein n=1 Tax=Nocardia goodfellowii TaxID=882446 RepID=A0ABS4QKE4_9NOCA|nr:hypothetical protein [Nocardia goodfellowii]MBP2192160.1 hypothetical protein [Nocardia goodfellowii]
MWSISAPAMRHHADFVRRPGGERPKSVNALCSAPGLHDTFLDTVWQPIQDVWAAERELENGTILDVRTAAQTGF